MIAATNKAGQLQVFNGFCLQVHVNKPNEKTSYTSALYSRDIRAPCYSKYHCKQDCSVHKVSYACTLVLQCPLSAMLETVTCT